VYLDNLRIAIVESFEGKDLINSDDLISPVLENYESFEKLGPIIGMSPAESTPHAYARILQVIGLTSRHGKAYLEFEQLVQLLKKWEQPYKAIALVRKEYTEEQYSIPAEFKQDIPGWNTYQKYAKYPSFVRLRVQVITNKRDYPERSNG
jgi:hypothetical protein